MAFITPEDECYSEVDDTLDAFEEFYYAGFFEEKTGRTKQEISTYTTGTQAAIFYELWREGLQSGDEIGMCLQQFDAGATCVNWVRND